MTPAETVLGFAGYVLDARRRLLLGPDGRPVDISSRAFELLHYLASHPHELIEKQRLIKAVWHNAVVEENNLHQQISALRKVLGEAAGEHRFIVTVTGQGFRFVQNVQQLDSLPVEQGRRYGRPVAAAIAIVILLAGGTYAALRGRESGSTRNVEAYNAYLAGRDVMNRFGSTRAREAIEQLERAVQLDKDFALAWAALAEAYTFAMDFPSSSPTAPTALQVQQRISRAALRAFELAPDAPETLRSAGMVSMQNRDWAVAERRLRRALEIVGPDDYDANLLYASFLMNVGRASAAVPYVERAMRARPSLLRPVVFRAALHEMRGELDSAESVLRASSALEGHDSLRKQGLIMIGLARRDRVGLRPLLTGEGERCPLLDDPPEIALRYVRKNYEEARARGLRADLLPMADFALLLGDRDLSLEALRASASTQTLHGIWRPALAEVRQMPEFGDFVRQVGLVDYWRASGDWGDFCHEAEEGKITCR